MSELSVDDEETFIVFGVFRFCIYMEGSEFAACLSLKIPLGWQGQGLSIIRTTNTFILDRRVLFYIPTHLPIVHCLYNTDT